MKYACVFILFAQINIILSSKCAAQISGQINDIESGNVYVIDVQSHDTLAAGKIMQNNFSISLNRSLDNLEALLALISCLQFDKKLSVVVPVAIENVPISVTIDQDGFASYAGTPVQERFSAFISTVRELDQLLEDRSAAAIRDSTQNEMGKEVEKFYLENRTTKLKTFASMIVTDLISRKLIDPNDLSTFKGFCDRNGNMGEDDIKICEAIELYSTQWVGKDFLDFNGTRSDLTDFKLQDEIGKKIIILDFWASWCGPCLKEMPELKNLYKNGNIEIIGISIDDNHKNWLDKLSQIQLPWPNIRDDGKVISKRYNVTAVPTKFVIDKEGIIVARNPENITEVIEKLED